MVFCVQFISRSCETKDARDWSDLESRPWVQLCSSSDAGKIIGELNVRDTRIKVVLAGRQCRDMIAFWASSSFFFIHLFMHHRHVWCNLLTRIASMLYLRRREEKTGGGKGQRSCKKAAGTGTAATSLAIAATGSPLLISNQSTDIRFS
jgi:hypothetical protein